MTTTTTMMQSETGCFLVEGMARMVLRLIARRQPVSREQLREELGISEVRLNVILQRAAQCRLVLLGKHDRYYKIARRGLAIIESDPLRVPLPVDHYGGTR